jgi:hypothetical protein
MVKDVRASDFVELGHGRLAIDHLHTDVVESSTSGASTLKEVSFAVTAC